MMSNPIYCACGFQENIKHACAVTYTKLEQQLTAERASHEATRQELLRLGGINAENFGRAKASESMLNDERAAHEETKRKLEKAETKNTAALNLKIELCEVLDTEFVSATDKDLLSYAKEFRRRALTAEAKLADLEAQIAKSKEREPHHWLWKFKDDSPDEWRLSVGPACPTYRDECETIECYTSPIIPPSTAELIEQARKEENESCAKVCDKLDEDGVNPFRGMRNVAHADDCAAAIRARMK